MSWVVRTPRDRFHFSERESNNKCDRISRLFRFDFIVDKFRIKFRELLSSCCCCCKSAVRMKPTSSTTRTFQVSSALHHHSQQPSPITGSSLRRYAKHNQLQRTPHGSLVVKNGHGQTGVNPSHHSSWIRHPANANPYTHAGSAAFRLTNV